jgi:hypothetical protein
MNSQSIFLASASGIASAAYESLCLPMNDAIVIWSSEMQLQVGKIYRVKSADTLKIRKHTGRQDNWSEVDRGYLKPGTIVRVEDTRHTTGGNAYLVRADDQSGELRFDCGVDLSESLELVG